jgi:hypothetical protein
VATRGAWPAPPTGGLGYLPLKLDG